MPPTQHTKVAAVVLTLGDRPEPLAEACRSLDASGVVDEVVVVWNGTAPDEPGPAVGCARRDIALPANLGIPGGRDVAIGAADAELVVCLDDDAAVLRGLAVACAAFADDAGLAAVALRLVDQNGHTSRRHVPRLGRLGVDRPGPVATFLGGACVIRRRAYDDVGGYWSDLWYGHEELDLAWRLTDAGWSVRYMPETTVFHPRSPIGRHAEGWRLTGRNRVWIARRNLPLPLLVSHTVGWLLIGAIRAPGRTARRAFLGGWWSGWKDEIGRKPIRWATVWRLTRAGRPPIV